MTLVIGLVFIGMLEVLAFILQKIARNKFKRNIPFMDCLKIVIFCLIGIFITLLIANLAGIIILDILKQLNIR